MAGYKKFKPSCKFSASKASSTEEFVKITVDLFFFPLPIAFTLASAFELGLTCSGFIAGICGWCEGTKGRVAERDMTVEGSLIL